MRAIPPSFTLEKLVGHQLTQVSLGPFDLQFGFGSKDFIQCVGRVIVEIDGQPTVVFDGKTWGDISPLKSIAGRDVVAWKIEASHEFSVTLTGGVRLRFQSTDSSHEDFIIHPEIQVA
jgi:hypothetical protein